MPKTKKPKINVYQVVTDTILAKLKEGVVPWQKPWTSEESAPRNLISGKAYRGINPFLLVIQGFGDPNWLTFKQAAELGYRAWLKDEGLKDSPENQSAYQDIPAAERGGVRKGEKGTLITFWKIIKGKDENGNPDTFPILRHYTVFNVEQCQGLNLKVADEVTEREPVDAIEAGEAIVKLMPNAPTIGHGGARAFYAPERDHVQMPQRDDFDSSASYYATLFHELVHSTGHKDRLNRKGMAEANFGSEVYSKEELVAEFGSAMVCASAGIEPNYDNSAAYIKGWMRKLADDPKLAVGAAGQAQKAADYILKGDQGE